MIIGAVLLSGCASQSGMLDRMRTSAVESVKDPNVWVPLAGGALMMVDNIDNRIARSAAEESRLFSDPQGSSNDIADLSALLYLVTLIGDRDASWATRATRVGKDFVSLGSALALTEGLKNVTQRERPQDDNNESFPSGHATRLGGLTYLTRRNLEQLELARGLNVGAQVAAYGLAASGAWARVEAGKHHPSDVLFGYALGHFTTEWVRRVFFQSDRVAITYRPMQTGGAISVAFQL